MKYGGKYGNIRSHGFDSLREEARYHELLLMQRAGKISDLRRQVPYLLIPAQYAVVDGKKKCIEKSVTYNADFVYTEDGQLIVEDVKGFKTDVYKLKKKLLLYTYGIRIKET